MKGLIKSNYIFLLVSCSFIINTMETTNKEKSKQEAKVFSESLPYIVYNDPRLRFSNMQRIRVLLDNMLEILNLPIEEHGVQQSSYFFDRVQMQVILSVDFIIKSLNEVSNEDKLAYLLLYYNWITSLIDQLIIFTKEGKHHESLRLFDRICTGKNKDILISIYIYIRDALVQYTKSETEIDNDVLSKMKKINKACTTINERNWPTYISVNENKEKQNAEREAQLALIKTQGKQENGRNKLPLIPIAITGVGLGLVIGLKKVLENTQYREQLITLWQKVPTLEEVKKALFTEFPRTIIEQKRKALLIGLLSTTGFFGAQYLVTKPEGLQERRYQKMTQWMHNKYNAAKHWVSS